MLFSEVYGSYFNVIAAVLGEAARGRLTERRLTEIVQEMAFAESVLSIPAALKGGEWPLLHRDLSTVIRHRPTMPLTTLQRRWLKALLLDPRIALFEPDCAGLEDVEPLYRPGTFVLFDQYADGDPYGDESYITNFRLALRAIREKRGLRIRFLSRAGDRHSARCFPYRLEYSAKDDKFRLLAADDRGRSYVVNMARIVFCEPLEERAPEGLRAPRDRQKELVMLLRDERKALERALLHFSHLEKETVRLTDETYEIRLRYDRDDETELLIRVLSFGPMLEVKAPDDFIALLRARIGAQMELRGEK